jgi:hypothetical protein
MVSEFPGSAISAVSLPNRGYVATIYFFLDSHRISAVAVPTFGRLIDGTRVPAYSFEVSHAGTMIVSAPPRAQSLFAKINQIATGIRPPIPAD